MPEVPDGSIVITTKELYDDVQTIKTTVQDIAASLGPLQDKVRELDARMTSVEKRMWIATGFAAAIGTSAGTFLAQVLGR